MSGLVLTRKPGEAIKIGDDITITFLRSRGGQASLHIDAPRSVAVHRQEYYEKLKAEEKSNR